MLAGTGSFVLGGSLVSAQSAGASTGVPDAPSNVVAQPGNASATVSFTVPADSGSPITGYLVAAFQGGVLQSIQGVSTNVVTTAGATQTMLYDPTGSLQLQNGSSYTFAAVAISAAGYSAESTQSAAITVGAPVAPLNVVVQPSGVSATVSFAVPADNGSPVTEYLVLAYSGGTLASAMLLSTGLVATPGATQTFAFDPTGSVQLQDGTSYTFAALAINAVGASPLSTPSLPVVPGGVGPAQPADVMSGPGNGTASVSFTELTYAGTPLTAYEVEVFEGGSLVGTQLVTTGLGVTASAAANETTTIGPANGGPTLQNGVGYTFAVVAFDAAGASPGSSAALTLVPNSSATTSTITPSASLPATIPAVGAYLAGRIEAAQVPQSVGVADGGGAIGESDDQYINVYMAGYAAAGLAAYGPAAGGTAGATAEADVLHYLQWYAYAESLNSKSYVFDWKLDTTTGTWVSTGTVDSTDSPPALFLLAADRYLAAMTAMGKQAAAVTNLSTPALATGLQNAVVLLVDSLDKEGLTEANPLAGYTPALLEDNAEVYGGLRAAAAVLQAIGTSTSISIGHLAGTVAGIVLHAVQEDMWVPSAGGFAWAYGSATATGPCTTSTCSMPALTYQTSGNPSIEANLWAVGWGLATPAQMATVMADPGVANYTGSFANPLVNGTPSTDIVNGQYAYPSTPNYIGAGLWSLQAAGDTSTAIVDLYGITDVADYLDGAWPFDNGAVGALLIGAEAGGVAVPS